MKPFAEMVGQRLWVHINGKTFVYETSGSKKRKTSAGEADKRDIAAPMPGKITDVLVKPDDRVSKGQVLVVMEAMKMEYTLKAERDGIIAEIRCSVGGQVNAGDILICLR